MAKGKRKVPDIKHQFYGGYCFLVVDFLLDYYVYGY